MKLKGVPNQVIHKRIRRQGKTRIVPWVRFDAEGFAEIDETKVSATDIGKLKRAGMVMIEREEAKVKSTEGVYANYTYKELVKLGKEKGIATFGVSRKKLIERLGEE